METTGVDRDLKRPNIVLIITDQQRYDTIAALGHPFVETPNLDRLVREGVSFDNCFITAPSCVPSRASLFTGYYPHTTGIYKNGDEWSRSWVEDLAAGGYRCVNVGKMHTIPFETPLGFHERYVVENKDRFLEGRYFFDEWDKALAARGLTKQQREFYRRRPDYRERLGAFPWELPEDLHSDMFVGNFASWWIEQYPFREPLFLQIGFPGPHPPYDPIPRWEERYARTELDLDEVDDEDLAGQPEPFRILREHNEQVDHDSVVHIQKPGREQRLLQRRSYLANVSMIDEQVGKILSALSEKGYLENTVVIFTSDHGDCLGDHGHVQKWNMYEQVVRVPALVWAPGRFPAGRRVDELVQLFDLGPTILELAGVAGADGMEAKSLLPFLAGGTGTPAGNPVGRRYVFAEHGRDGILTGTEVMTMVRDERWKLVHFIDHPRGQLFDLSQDPGEKRNLWDEPEAAKEKERLLAALRDWMIDSSYRSRTWKKAARVNPTERRSIVDERP